MDGDYGWLYRNEQRTIGSQAERIADLEHELAGVRRHLDRALAVTADVDAVEARYVGMADELRAAQRRIAELELDAAFARAHPSAVAEDDDG